MSGLDVAGIKARLAAASPGPWRAAGVDIDQLTDGGQGFPLEVYPDSKSIVIGKCEDCGSYAPGIQTGHDATFIAAARTDVELLIAEVERLNTERDVLVEANRATFDQLSLMTNDLSIEQAWHKELDTALALSSSRAVNYRQERDATRAALEASQAECERVKGELAAAQALVNDTHLDGSYSDGQCNDPKCCYPTRDMQKKGETP